MMKCSFESYHPAIILGYFIAVIGIGVFMIHPVFLIIGVTAAFTFALITGGRGTLKFALCFLLPVIIVVTMVNPIINHRGATILFYTKYSYITLEAAIYGFMMGLMMAVTLLWFSSFNKIMTSDKITYIFGKIMPSTSLLFSMVMRFVPNYKDQIKKISDAQKCIGQDASNGTIRDRAKHGMRIVSIMFTWALENSIDTADSMKSRGYGLDNRSNFSIFRFDRRDIVSAVFLVSMVAIVLSGIISGSCHVEFYPNFIIACQNGIKIWLKFAAYVAFALICYFPSLTELVEVLKWRKIKANM